MTERKRTVVVMADASFDPASREGGWAAMIIDGDMRHAYSGVLRGCQDCGHAELVALAAGARIALESLKWMPGEVLCLSSDSMHALNALAGQKKSLRDIDREIALSFRGALVRSGVRFEIRHVPGHQGRATEDQACNAWADSSARAGLALNKLVTSKAA